MNKPVLFAIAGAVVVGVFLLWKMQPPAKTTGETTATPNPVTPINNGAITSKSAQLQNGLIQVGAGLAANFLDGLVHQTEPSGENGGVDTHVVQSTAPTTYVIS